MQRALSQRHWGATAVVIGSPAIHDHVRAAGLHIVNGSPWVAGAHVVVLAGHDDFAYGELREATPR
jgi:hypothetical protein